KMWDENITPRYEDTALHYLLCQALPKTVLENISTLSDSAEDIWHYFAVASGCFSNLVFELFYFNCNYWIFRCPNRY
ncbi:MAG: hypothetical protein AAFR89_08510, partial [Cyanobacteria bacterium J06633_1]